jgi:hypothetical protein
VAETKVRVQDDTIRVMQNKIDEIIERGAVEKENIRLMSNFEKD